MLHCKFYAFYDLNHVSVKGSVLINNAKEMNVPTLWNKHALFKRKKCFLTLKKETYILTLENSLTTTDNKTSFQPQNKQLRN